MNKKIMKYHFYVTDLCVLPNSKLEVAVVANSQKDARIKMEHIFWNYWRRLPIKYRKKEFVK